MKKVLAFLLAAVMCTAMAACTTKTGDPQGYSGDVKLNIMLMPQGDMNDATVSKVTEAVNNRISELGYEFSVDFTWSGGAWGWDKLDLALQTGASNLDIVPAHSWSGSVTYTVGAKNGQYLRLDDPENNLIEMYGDKLYSGSSPAIVAAATVDGDQGYGIYGFIIEKDSVTEQGYLVNKTILEELGFTLEDFNAADLASWEPILAAYKEKYPKGYPLNIESEILDRTVNYVAFVDTGISTLSYIFDGKDAQDAITSRYETESYRDFIAIMQGYYSAGYVDPDQTVPGEISSGSIAARRDSGDYLISTMVWVPGYDAVYSASATQAQGKDIEIVYISPWESAIGTSETAQGSGLAVYAGTKYAPEAVTFLNLLASDEVIANLVAEGIEGECYEPYENGTIRRINNRSGWNIWRYGVAGANSNATTLWDLDQTGNEWVNFKDFNSSADSLPIMGWMFSRTPVENQVAACKAIIDKYAIPLGTGASTDYDAFIKELKAAGLDEIITEANAQYDSFSTAK